MGYACRSRNCKQVFTNERSLTVHRTNCIHYKRHEAAAAAKRKERSEALRRQRTEALDLVRWEVDRKRKLHEKARETEDVQMGAMASASHDDLPEPYAPEQLPSPSIRLPSPPIVPVLTSTGRPQRTYRLPARYNDIQPAVSAPLPPAASLPPIPPGSYALPRVILHVRDWMRTDCNTFNILREYAHRPSYDPDSFLSEDDLSNYPGQCPSNSAESAPPSLRPPPWPFQNMSIYLLMEWMITGSNKKSIGEVDRLASDVLGSKDFNLEDLAGFSARRENKRLDLSEEDSPDSPYAHDGWLESSVEISVPTGSKDSSGRGALFTVPGLHHRPLLSVMKNALVDVTARYFHFSPFKRIWKPSVGPEQRCFDEVYTSDSWIKLHNDLQKQPNEPGCKLEKVILGLMFWSDSTHLANFGTAKVWPIYMYFANLSKYFRGKADSAAAHHIAYIPSLPDNIQDTIEAGSQTANILTHCRRELMHKVWDCILDDDFTQAYEHGFTMECLDGVWRRFYPRIFTYSADYPEKVLIATVRNRGICPCPRCLVSKADLHKLGQITDMKRRISTARKYMGDIIRRARDFIYKLGLNVAGAAVERLLHAHSWFPTLNTFAEKLGPYGLDPFVMLTVDLLHEFELGVWKTIFTHLIRLLYAVTPGGRMVTELDRRFRQIPTFGRGTIRRFATNASEMKKLAARNYEDLLQCAIPVFEGLLPSTHNDIVMTMLFRLAEWHAFAKLRMHTESTLTRMESVTTVLGRELRKFSNVTCSAFSTVELPRETAARGRRRARTQAKAAKPDGPDGSIAPALSSGMRSKKRCKKKLNLSTYKLHSLGDYVRTIRMFGTTDSFSTQPGEREHRRPKRLYGRTNKNLAIKQMTKHERRETRLLRARRATCANTPRPHTHHVDFSESDPLPYTDPSSHHHISDSRKRSQDLFSFQKEFPDDPATKDFVPKLKDHLLGRLLNRDYDGDEETFTDGDRNTVRIIDNHVYSAKVLRVNYTTYDVRRDQDSMNPRTQCDIMVTSRETGPNAHPFWYARVLGVFHVRVVHTGAAATNRSIQRMEFLWVRWFGIEIGHRYGFKVARLPKVGFVEENDPSAFGFLDPSLVLRGCHLIPSFVNGRTSDLLKTIHTAARPPGEFDDWAAFYVNIFVDRDMFMRFLGGGVGHQTAQQQGMGVDDMDIDDTGAEIEEDFVRDDRNLSQGEDSDGEEEEDDNEDDEDEGDDEDEDNEEDEGDDEDSDGDLGAEDGEDYEEMEDEYDNL